MGCGRCRRSSPLCRAIHDVRVAALVQAHRMEQQQLLVRVCGRRCGMMGEGRDGRVWEMGSEREREGEMKLIAAAGEGVWTGCGSLVWDGGRKREGDGEGDFSRPTPHTCLCFIALTVY